MQIITDKTNIYETLGSISEQFIVESWFIQPALKLLQNDQNWLVDLKQDWFFLKKIDFN